MVSCELMVMDWLLVLLVVVSSRSEHANEFKILIQTTLSEESLGNLVGHSSDGDDDEDDGSPGNSSRRCLVLLACTIVGFVMNVLVSVVAPFFPQEAKRLTHTNNTVIGFIFAIFPLTSLMVSPLINMVGMAVLLHQPQQPSCPTPSTPPHADPMWCCLWVCSRSAGWAASRRCAWGC